jgi:hypothetical protein
VSQVTQQDRERLIRLNSIFYPDATRRRKEMHDKGERVVHYTSADCAMKIISGQTMWLRNTNCMSDYTEVALGFRYLQHFFGDESREQRFVARASGRSR